MKRFIFLAAISTLVASSLLARQWPDDSESMTVLFGMPEEGGFSRGITFRSEGQRVGAWNDGEVIWKSCPIANGEGIPGEGLVVIEHPGGFRTTYRGIECRPDLDKSVSAGDWVGYADGGEWSFSITDIKRGRTIDPLLSLPSRSELIIPGGYTLYFGDGEGERAVFDGMALPPGRWSVFVDPVVKEDVPYAVSEISLYWVGQRIAGLGFESLAEDEGRIVMETPEGKPYEAVYDQSGRISLGAVGLNAGRGVLELRIKDDSGRITAYSWHFTVRSGE